MCKELSQDRSKVENTLLNATKASSYWEKEDYVNYGEWLIIEMFRKRLLDMHTMAEAVGKRVRVAIPIGGRINDQAVSIPIDIDMEIDTNGGGHNGGNITVININGLLLPTKKAKPDRVMLKR